VVGSAADAVWMVTVVATAWAVVLSVAWVWAVTVWAAVAWAAWVSGILVSGMLAWARVPAAAVVPAGMAVHLDS
jgi:hypothetical protein